MITLNQPPLPHQPNPFNTNPSYLARTLRAAAVTPVDFDPANADHRKSYVTFMQTGKWNTRFNTKWPSPVLQTVQTKLAEYACKMEMN